MSSSMRPARGKAVGRQPSRKAAPQRLGADPVGRGAAIARGAVVSPVPRAWSRPPSECVTPEAMELEEYFARAREDPGEWSPVPSSVPTHPSAPSPPSSPSPTPPVAFAGSPSYEPMAQASEQTDPGLSALLHELSPTYAQGRGVHVHMPSMGAKTAEETDEREDWQHELWHEGPTTLSESLSPIPSRPQPAAAHSPLCIYPSTYSASSASQTQAPSISSPSIGASSPASACNQHAGAAYPWKGLPDAAATRDGPTRVQGEQEEGGDDRSPARSPSPPTVPPTAEALAQPFSPEFSPREPQPSRSPPSPPSTPQQRTPVPLAAPPPVSVSTREAAEAAGAAAEAALAACASSCRVGVFVTRPSLVPLLLSDAVVCSAQCACGAEARVKLGGNKQGGRPHVSARAADEAALDRALLCLLRLMRDKSERLEIEVRWLLRNPAVPTQQLCELWADAVEEVQAKYPLRQVTSALHEPTHASVCLTLHADGWEEWEETDAAHAKAAAAPLVVAWLLSKVRYGSAALLHVALDEAQQETLQEHPAKIRALSAHSGAALVVGVGPWLTLCGPRAGIKKARALLAEWQEALA